MSSLYATVHYPLLKACLERQTRRYGVIGHFGITETVGLVADGKHQEHEGKRRCLLAV